MYEVLVWSSRLNCWTCFMEFPVQEAYSQAVCAGRFNFLWKVLQADQITDKQTENHFHSSIVSFLLS